MIITKHKVALNHIPGIFWYRNIKCRESGYLSNQIKPANLASAVRTAKPIKITNMSAVLGSGSLDPRCLFSVSMVKTISKNKVIQIRNDNTGNNKAGFLKMIQETPP
jgi:hypothetical protein